MSAEEMYLYVMEREKIETNLDSVFQLERRWKKIEEAYQGRPYHNLDHIDVVIGRIMELLGNRSLDTNINALWSAAIYHDIVYVPGASYNEMGSAAYAAVDLGQRGLESGLTNEVMRLIHVTEHVNFDPNLDTAGKLIADADLYELSTDKYQENRDHIREEFSEATELQWTKGRYDFLLEMLSRPKLFHLSGRMSADDRNAPQLDLDARHNMVKEINEELDLELLAWDGAEISLNAPFIGD